MNRRTFLTGLCAPLIVPAASLDYVPRGLVMRKFETVWLDDKTGIWLSKITRDTNWPRAPHASWWRMMDDEKSAIIGGASHWLAL